MAVETHEVSITQATHENLLGGEKKKKRWHQIGAGEDSNQIKNPNQRLDKDMSNFLGSYQPL